MLRDSQLAVVRSRFPIFRNKVYLNSCSQGALSDAVEANVRAYLESWHEFGSPWDMWVEKYEEIRRAFARFIGASADEVAIVTSASNGINTVASALEFSARKKIVLGEFEFPTMGHVWLAQRPRGADVQFVASQGHRIPLTNYEKAIDDQTLLVGLTRICFMNGFRSDVAGVVRAAHGRGALVLLDDYQDCGTRPVDVKALGVDFYVTGTLKYLLGPPGLAFLYVRKDLAEKLLPTASGWFAQRNPFAFNPKLLDPAPNARRFESGSPSIPNIYAATGGLDVLQTIGLDNVAAQIAKLAKALIEGAAALGLRVKTPEDSVGPLVVIEAKNAEALVQQLAREGFVCSSRHDGLRISFHVYNTLDDIRAVLDALGRNLDLLVSGRVTAAHD